MKLSMKLGALCLFFLLGACATGDPEAKETETTRKDETIVTPDQTIPDNKPEPKQTTVFPSSGGGNITTPKYNGRILIAPPSVVSNAETPKYKVQLGSGAAQHGQK